MQKVISKDGTTTLDSTPLAARLSFGAGIASLLFLATLHVLSPEFDPSWRMVSEYALGNYGWALTLMFLSQALSCIALFFALKSQIQTVGGKIGLFFLLTACLGMTMAAKFDWRSSLHGLSALIGIPSLLIASIVISVSLGRKQAWSSARNSLLLTTSLTWMSFIWMLATIFIGLAHSNGKFGPDVLVGWPNRALIIAYTAWLMIAAWQMIRLHEQNS